MTVRTTDECCCLQNSLVCVYRCPFSFQALGAPGRVKGTLKHPKRGDEIPRTPLHVPPFYDKQAFLGEWWGGMYSMSEKPSNRAVGHVWVNISVHLHQKKVVQGWDQGSRGAWGHCSALLGGSSVRRHLTSMPHSIGSRGFMVIYRQRQVAHSPCGNVRSGHSVDPCLHVHKQTYSPPVSRVQGRGAQDTALRCWSG